MYFLSKQNITSSLHLQLKCSQGPRYSQYPDPDVMASWNLSQISTAYSNSTIFKANKALHDDRCVFIAQEMSKPCLPLHICLPPGA